MEGILPGHANAAEPSASGTQRYSFIILSGSSASAFSGTSSSSAVSIPVARDSAPAISDSVKFPCSSRKRGFFGSGHDSNFSASSAARPFLNSSFADSIFWVYESGIFYRLFMRFGFGISTLGGGNHGLKLL